MIVIITLVLLNSMVFIAIAVHKSITAYIMVGTGKLEGKPGVLLAESLDSFMVALFFIIFSIGISKLFLPGSSFLSGYDLPWLKIENFSQLKYLLWEVLLTTLFVIFGAQVILHEEHLEWTMLIMPAAILMLALAFKLLKQGH